jgi:hypothetical protein
MFVQAKAGQAQGSTTERYLHAHRTSYPGAGDLAEARLFASEVPSSVPGSPTGQHNGEKLLEIELPGLDSNQ